MPKRRKNEKTKKIRPSRASLGRLVSSPRTTSLIAAAAPDSTAVRGYIHQADEADVLCKLSLGAENAELRDQVVELALKILDLQLRLRPDQRSRWADFLTSRHYFGRETY